MTRVVLFPDENAPDFVLEALTPEAEFGALAAFARDAKVAHLVRMAEAPLELGDDEPDEDDDEQQSEDAEVEGLPEEQSDDLEWPEALRTHVGNVLESTQARDRRSDQRRGHTPPERLSERVSIFPQLGKALTASGAEVPEVWKWYAERERRQALERRALTAAASVTADNDTTLLGSPIVSGSAKTVVRTTVETVIEPSETT